MSNRAVPGVYRQIMDDVVNGVRPDFDEMGIDERVLDALQKSWEAKLAVSGVANFEEDAAMAPFAKHARQQQQASAAQAAPSTSRPAARGSSNAPQSGGSGNQSSSAHQNAKASSSSKSKTEEPEDEDELGSDLDDPEDDADAGQDGTAGIDSGDFIIALYEKVSRVKNKWKIQLKDGVVSADGKDYLFSKCNGDFQW